MSDKNKKDHVFEEEKSVSEYERIQKMLEEAEHKGKEALKRFQRASKLDDGRKEQIIENQAFYEGKQYRLLKYKDNRQNHVKMRTPYASVAVDTRVASLIASDYYGKLFPFKQEDAEAVDILNDVVRDEMDRDKTPSKINECIGRSAVVRTTYLHVLFDENVETNTFDDGRKGAITSYVIDNPQSVVIDPEALSLKEAEWVIIPTRITYAEAKLRYGEIVDAIREQGASEFSIYDRGEDYISNKDRQTEQDEVPTLLHHYYKKVVNVSDEGEEPKYKKIVCKDVVLNKWCVETKEFKATTRFPIAQMRWKKEMNSPYGLSLYDDLISLQKAINTIESSVTAVAMAYSMPSYILQRGSGINPELFSQTIGLPGTVYVTNVGVDETLRPVQVPNLDDSIVQVMDKYKNEIDRIAGITNPYLGSVGTAGNTAQGAKLSVERARIIEADVLRNIQEFVEDITDIFVEIIQNLYSGSKLTSRVVDFAEGKVSWKEVEIPESIADVKYSFYIDLESKTPFAREREKEKLAELIQMQNQYQFPEQERVIRVTDLIDSLDMKDKEKYHVRYEENRIYNLETQVETVMQLTEIAQEVNIDETLLQSAISDVLNNLDREKKNLDLFIKTAKEQQMLMQQNTEMGLGEIANTLAEGGEDPSQPLEALAELEQPQGEETV